MIEIIPTEEIALFGIDFLYTLEDKHRQHVTNCILRKFGQFKPLLVERDPNGIPHLVAGSYVLRALKQLEIPFAYCWVFDKLSVTDTLTINLIDNQHRDLDVIRAAKALDMMRVEGEVNYKALANVLHHTRDEIHNFKELKDFNWEDFDNDPGHFQYSIF